MLPVSKLLVGIEQVTTTNAGTAVATFDTIGFDFASIDIVMGTSDDTTNNPTVFKLVENTDAVTNASSVTDISGFVGDTDWTIPAADTSNANLFKFNVDLRGRDRFIGVRISPLTTHIITASANLFRGDEAPITAGEVGVDAVVSG